MMMSRMLSLDDVIPRLSISSMVGIVEIRHI